MSELRSTLSVLQGLNPSELFACGLNPVRPSGMTSMILRVSAQGGIRYINTTFATYLGLTVEELTGQPVEVAKQLCSPQVAECMDMETASMAASGLVTDTTGRVFEPLVSLDAGVLDVILTEVTPGAISQDSFQSLTGVALAEIDETELRTLRHLEASDVSILAVRIHSPDALTRSQTRHDLRILLDAIEEETVHAVTSLAGTVAGAGIGCFLGIFGAPQHFQDHALRAVVGATELRKKLIGMAASFAEDGKSFPKLGLAIWTGEALAGVLGGQRLGAYSAIGTPVQAALELSNLATEGEILLGDPTLAELIASPPEGWTFQSVQTESDPDLTYFQWSGSTIFPLPDELSRRRCEMVPADSPDGPAHFTFEYLWNLQPAGAEEPAPVVRLLDGEAASVLPLREASGRVQGHALGRYKLLEVLGAGGMGQVWLAKDRFGHPVAIKVLNAHGTPDSQALKRFRREGEAMAKLRHRSICRIYEMNEVDGISFIAMEYVSGISLSGLLSSLPESTAQRPRTKTSDSELTDLIRSAKRKQPAQKEQEQTDESVPAPRARSQSPLPVEQALTLFLKICEAVQFAHEHGVLHRDLKPANILLREDGEPLVADFGLAKLADSDEEASLSLTGNIVGTIQNMAPEQADSSKHVDERADVYSLGTILYQMLTGRPHFMPTGNIVIDGPKLQEHQPVRPRIHNPAIDADIETIVLKCLRLDPLRRYRSVRALWEDLDRYRRGEPIDARPVSPAEIIWKQVLRHKTVSVLSAVFLLVLGFGTVAAFWQISERATIAQAAAAEAEVQRKEADVQRQLALGSQKDAEEKQALAEHREREAKESAQTAQAREKEAQEAVAALRNAEAETEKESQLRISADEDATKSKQLRLVAEKQAKEGFAPEPLLTLHEQYLRKGISIEESTKYYRKEVEKALNTFLSGLSAVTKPAIVTYGQKPFPIPGRMSARGVPPATEMRDTWSFSGVLPSDLVSKLGHIDQVLSLYTLCDPEHGLPLLRYFKLSVFDVDGAISITESMRQRGMEPEFQVTPKTTVDYLRFQLEALNKKKGTLESQFLQIRDQLLRSVQIQASLPLPATTFTRCLSRQLSLSDISTAAGLGNWNADAIVNLHGNKSYDFADSVTATGKGVVTLAPLFACYQGSQSLDISYSSVPVLQTPLNTAPPRKLIARHSALRAFEQKNGVANGFIMFVDELDISYSQFTSFEQILEIRSLRKLSAVGIPAKDARVLFLSKHGNSSLEELDIAEVPISSFAGVSQFRNLRSLRFSPELLQDKASINELRTMQLKIISTPYDQPNQSATSFWEKWDRGDSAQ